MTNPLKLFILAGEPSGDRLAADLVGRLRGRVPLILTGVGGDELKATGLVSLYPMGDLAVMGISDVLRRLPLLLWRVEQTARAIRAGRPPPRGVGGGGGVFTPLLSFPTDRGRGKKRGGGAGGG
ncbi:MAG: hypothetical protein MO852_03555, partial [Candidatus Devosia euplotis]|nr:hypothetical protein [Candidatus Devosia euplotis]